MRRWPVLRRVRYVSFDSAIKEAEAEAIAGRIQCIQKAEDHSWQAAAWWLERRYPQDFGRTIREHTGMDFAPVKHQVTVHDLSQFSDEQIEKLVALADEIEAGERKP